MPYPTTSAASAPSGLLGQDDPGQGIFGAAVPLSSQGMIAKGNIDLYHRPIVRNRDGSISTVRSASFNIDGHEVLIPTVAADGSRILSDDEAVAQYRRTGQHLGIFSSPEAATYYAKSLHLEQERLYAHDRR